MRIAKFSLQRYRSISQAEKLPLGDLTILVGPNNEGKSNILRGLVVGMRMLALADRVRVVRGRLTPSRAFYDSDDQEDYVWERDFPVSLQAKKPDGRTIFDFEFELSQEEIADFRREIKSDLNGLLPIRLALGQADVEIGVRKKGPGGPALTAKRDSIAKFVGRRLDVKYIPSVRTARHAMRVVNDMVSRETRGIEQTEAFQAAMKEIEELQMPLLEKLSVSVQESLRAFLPDVRSVEIKIPWEARMSALAHSQMVVDDGTATDLQFKGDGVQSLAAISLIRHVSQERSEERELVLAIEEPEAHLHPRAIHQLRAVLNDIASTQQVVMTTHSPLLTNRLEIQNNIIVDRNRARKATNVRELRDVLGVRVSDNLAMAQFVLVVEGQADGVALLALLKKASKLVSGALAEGTFAIEHLSGSGNLSYKLAQLNEALCMYHVFLDNDQAGRAASERAELDDLPDPSRRTLASCPGRKDSEFEDLLNENLYAQYLIQRYNVDLEATNFAKSRAKWSDRMKRAFQSQGQSWDEAVRRQVKSEIARLVSDSPANALQQDRAGAFSALSRALENRIRASAAASR
jgi:predicted ATP-dependent endonuclease of OLD family